MALQNNLRGCYWTNFTTKPRIKPKRLYFILFSLFETNQVGTLQLSPNAMFVGHFLAEIGSLDQFFY